MVWHMVYGMRNTVWHMACGIPMAIWSVLCALYLFSNIMVGLVRSCLCNAIFSRIQIHTSRDPRNLGKMTSSYCRENYSLGKCVCACVFKQHILNITPKLALVPYIQQNYRGYLLQIGCAFMGFALKCPGVKYWIILCLVWIIICLYFFLTSSGCLSSKQRRVAASLITLLRILYQG
jgi:hypothetical protein